MSKLASLAPGRYVIPPYPVRRFTVAEYHHMIRMGFFAADDRFELLDGWITPKMPRNPPHDSFIAQVNGVLSALMPPDWRVRVQSAVTLSASEPEPDLAVVPGLASTYRASHPGPGDVALVVEVANTTLNHDRDVKGPIYARDSLPIYWIVNIVDRRVEAYSDPTGPVAQPCYRQCRHAHLNDSVDLILAGQVIATIPCVDLLG